MLYDGILITGVNDTEHLEILTKVKKCRLKADSVDYLRHRIDAQGLNALSEKVEAITKATVPKNITELQSFLGLLNYYQKFLPNIATILKPLNEL